MGHIRLGVLPTSKKWTQVVALLSDNAGSEAVAAASARAAEAALSGAADDPIFLRAAWLLTNLPLAARAPECFEAFESLGLDLDAPPSLFALTGAVSGALDDEARRTGDRSDLGEMAQMALVESLAAAIEPQLPSLFDPDPAEVRSALGKLSQSDRFASLARDFFTRLTQRSLDYFLSRELANHIGIEGRFPSDAERRAFDAAIAQHCREASRIVEEYAGGWYGKTVWKDGALTEDAVRRFARYGFKKIRDELGRRRDAA